MQNASAHFLSIISDTDKQIFEAFIIFFSGIISIFAVATNIMNIAVFYRQGFRNAVTISLLGLAISDLCSLVTSLGLGESMNPLLVNSDRGVVPLEMLHLTVGTPHACFTEITSWIIVVVTAERCLCISLSLKIKQMITTRRTPLVVILIHILATSCGKDEYSTVYCGLLSLLH